MYRLIWVEYRSTAHNDVADVETLSLSQPRPEPFDWRVVLTLDLDPWLEFIFGYVWVRISSVSQMRIEFKHGAQ